MASFHTGIAALLLTGLALTAAPSFAGPDGRRNGREAGRRDGGERAQPRGGESQQRAQPRGHVEQPQRWYDDRRSDARSSDHRGYDNRRNDNRGYDNRGYDNRSYGHRSYGYHPYGHQSYGFPFGYRPYGYRPGWSLDLYFGQPYSTYGYPAYEYPSAGYGYYSVAPGRAYGAIRIVDAPRDAQVFVDGYYAGVVDDYDGVFQHLNLEAGPHHIQIEAQGYPPIAFDVRVEPGQTVTYHANIG